MNIISKAFAHFKLVCRHKYYVGKYCFKAGIPLQGILHDLSKFSPVEFFESVKYFQGNRSPIEACKEDKGYSNAWLHHKGRNKHHYHYWFYLSDNDKFPVKMPFKYAVELICDYLGAGHAYMGDDFSYQAEYEWWLDKSNRELKIHYVTLGFINYCLLSFACGKELNKEFFKKLKNSYNNSEDFFQKGIN